MRSDVLYSHSGNIHEQVGLLFQSIPIYRYSPLALDVAAALESQRAVLISKGTEYPNTAEVLPGEVICADNIIRRTTTAEAIGYDTFKEKQAVQQLVGGQQKLQYDSEENAWGFKESKARQSTPEEISAWLNAQSWYKLVSSVEVDGDDKTVYTKDKAGKTLCAMRYVGGIPGTYVGGGEIRPFEPPQGEQGYNPDSRVVECFIPPTEAKVYREPVVLPEYADEFIDDCAPMSHVDFIMFGSCGVWGVEDAEQ